MPISDCSKHRTPCEILREINDHAQGILPNDKRIRELACELEKMLKKLLPDVVDVEYEPNEDFQFDLCKRARPTYRYEGETRLSVKDMGEDDNGAKLLKVIRC